MYNELVLMINDCNKDCIKAKSIIDALGGTDNIVNVTNCATRLRVKLKNLDLINEEELKETNAYVVMYDGQEVQIVYGPSVGSIKIEVARILEK